MDRGERNNLLGVENIQPWANVPITWQWAAWWCRSNVCFLIAQMSDHLRPNLTDGFILNEKNRLVLIADVHSVRDVWNLSAGIYATNVTFIMYRIPSIYTEHKGLHVGSMVRTFSTQQGSLLCLCSLLTSLIHTFSSAERMECNRTTLRVKRSIRPTWAELGGGHIWNWSAPVKQNRCYSFTLFLVALHHLSWPLAGRGVCHPSPHLRHAALLGLVFTHLSVGVLSILKLIQLPSGWVYQRHALSLA